MAASPSSVRPSDEEHPGFCIVQIMLPRRMQETYLPSIRRVAKLVPTNASMKEVLRIVETQMEPSDRYSVKCGNVQIDRDYIGSIGNLVTAQGRVRLHVDLLLNLKTDYV